MAAWGVDSETGRLTEVLLGPPDHFRWRPVGAVSRESMRHDKPFDHQTAVAQHSRMVEVYEELGITVQMLEARPELNYAVFARDSSFMTPWGPVISLIQTRWRRGDYAIALKFWEERGIPIWNMVTAGHFEGGDFMVVEPGLVFCGHGGERSEEEGARQVAEWFRKEGWEAVTVPFPPYFVHLDVTFAMIAPKLALCCTEAHEPVFLDVLKAKGIRVIEARYGEAVKLGCNVVALGDDRVLSTAENTRLNEAMRAEGLTVHDPDLSMFTRGGGGPHCLSQAIRREPLAAA